MTILEQLVPILRRQPTADDRQRASLHLLDWLGSAALGAQTAIGQKLAELWRLDAGPGSCSALGQGQADPQTSLFFNATLGNILEMDDVHRTSILHPGPVVIPTALAYAEANDHTAEELLNAIICGYEAVIRIGRGLGPVHYQYWHNTSTAGAFGAAAAVCSLRQASEREWLDALANAGTRTGGLWQMRNEECQSKQLHNGWAALTGRQAALAAAVGLQGPAAMLEGPQGLLTATAAGGRPDAIIEQPQGEWLLWQCSFKPWPACRHTHPSIDAALAFSGSVDAISELTVATYRDAMLFCDKPAPESELQAKFSLQHCVAITLLRGAPGLTDFDAAARADTTVAELRSRITVTEDESLTAAFPNAYRATLTIKLHDGSQQTIAIDNVLGDPGKPMSSDAIIAKATQLLQAAGYRQEQITTLLSGIDTLAQGGEWLPWAATLAEPPTAAGPGSPL
ncbi:MmgE/PrpD family protein [Halioxenophilus sp. WMMB6]|uniref:MmgE/PrpD family protein n=1 Tax=Halioxenophilus sp. WMMB6 TaxID=3073815 RepID=UPI00295ED4BD|nr:MmgE/PrpD family protein [Halioxenophilus sp. WMMB6]